MAYLMISHTASLSNFVYHYQKLGYSNYLLRIFLKFQTKFDKDAVRDIIRYAIKENVGTSQQYDAKLITTWSNELMEACLVALTKLQKPFKYIGMILKYKVGKILKGSLDSIPSPSPSMKNQIMGGKVCLRRRGKTLLGVVNKFYAFLA